eukprot:CAMPEP_0177796136 /NCGR_PEP_ID=MMETSP0491_2-20121128/26620_1 /TAXON_ID=63592 /ORGANISM="Tetraselmis chuii, Strain PLY429" /LENGTH=110 /DNA_ID=CAMNT_0019319043 /DNA_START=203 /DNA_END=533 /DNA_ORIENTATION=+
MSAVRTPPRNRAASPPRHRDQSPVERRRSAQPDSLVESVALRTAAYARAAAHVEVGRAETGGLERAGPDEASAGLRLAVVFSQHASLDGRTDQKYGGNNNQDGAKQANLW